MSDTFRLSITVSKRVNEWLDKRSKETAISKTALVNVAIENYIKEIEVVHGLPEILEQLKKHGVDLSES